MNIKIPCDVLKDFITSTNLLASEDSLVYLREDHIAVSSVLPMNNLLYFPLDGTPESGHYIKVKLSTFVGGIKMLVGKNVTITQAGPYQIRVSSGQRNVTVSDIAISDDKLPNLEIGENVTNALGQDIMPILATHKKNFVNSSVKASIDGIFFLNEFALSTNEYSFLTTQLISSQNRDLGIFLPATIAKLILAIKDTGVEHFISFEDLPGDKPGRRARAMFSRFEVLLPAGLFEPDQAILETIQGILERSGELKCEAKVTVEQLLEAIDPRAIGQSNAEVVLLEAGPGHLDIELVASNGSKFNADLELSDSSFEPKTVLTLPADEVAKMLDIISEYGRINLGYDGELLVVFSTKIDRFIVGKMN